MVPEQVLPVEALWYLPVLCRWQNCGKPTRNPIHRCCRRGPAI
jgi:hypothetical protein